jgi:hypothetical protein
MKGKYLKIAGISALALLILILTAATFMVQGGSDGAKKHAEEVTQYVCSMHPQVIRDSPGDCPICGMMLIELVALDQNKYDSSMTDIVRPVNSSVLAAVRTVIPEQVTIPVVIEASGIVSYDPRKVQTVSARFGGVIEKSFVRYQFQHIRKGDKIFEIFAPNIFDDRWNYVRLIQTYPDREDLTAEALEWFRLIGLTKGQIDTLKKTIRPDYHFAVYSPADGYSVSLDFNPSFSAGEEKEGDPGSLPQGYGGVGLTDGKSVGTGEPLFRLADVRSLLVDLKVKTEDGSLLKRGQKVIISDPVFPDRSLSGEIDQVEPLNGGIFQSVRIYIRDNERVLSPGRQVRAGIVTGERDGLWVPASAVVNLGTRRTVMVRNDDKFVPVEVRTGVETEGRIEILSGISATSEIAEKALLLIDSDGFIAPGQEVPVVGKTAGDTE